MSYTLYPCDGANLTELMHHGIVGLREQLMLPCESGGTQLHKVFLFPWGVCAAISLCPHIFLIFFFIAAGTGELLHGCVGLLRRMREATAIRKQWKVRYEA